MFTLTQYFELKLFVCSILCEVLKVVLLSTGVLECSTVLLGLTTQCQIVRFCVVWLTAHGVGIVTNLRMHGMCVSLHQIALYIYGCMECVYRCIRLLCMFSLQSLYTINEFQAHMKSEKRRVCVCLFSQTASVLSLAASVSLFDIW